MARQVNLDRVAQPAEFMAALADVSPVDQALAAGVEPEEPYALVEGLLPALPAHLDAETCARFQAWWSGYQAHPQRYEYTPALLHGDICVENILLSPDLSHAVGVVDFEQVRIGDAVSEFAVWRYLGDEFVDRVRAHYRPADALEPNFEERLRAAILLREIGRSALCAALSGVRRTGRRRGEGARRARAGRCPARDLIVSSRSNGSPNSVGNVRPICVMWLRNWSILYAENGAIMDRDGSCCHVRYAQARARIPVMPVPCLYVRRQVVHSGIEDPIDSVANHGQKEAQPCCAHVVRLQ